MPFTTPPILHEPVKLAPGSIDSLVVFISPMILAVDFNRSNSLTFKIAFNVPEISAFLQVTSPSIIPVAPTTTFPSEIGIDYSSTTHL